MENIIQHIEQEIKRLDAAKALLQGSNGNLHERPKKRTMSAKARKAIAAAQKKRWAKQKAQPIRS